MLPSYICQIVGTPIVQKEWVARRGQDTHFIEGLGGKASLPYRIWIELLYDRVHLYKLNVQLSFVHLSSRVMSHRRRYCLRSYYFFLSFFISFFISFFLSFFFLASSFGVASSSSSSFSFPRAATIKSQTNLLTCFLFISRCWFKNCTREPSLIL